MRIKEEKMKKIIFSLTLILTTNALANKHEWDCEDKVVELNNKLYDIKVKKNTKNEKLIKQFLKKVQDVAIECKTTHVSQDFDMDGGDHYGTDNLFIEGRSLLNHIPKPKSKEGIVANAKYLSYDHKLNYAIFEIDHAKVEFNIPYSKLRGHKNELMRIKYNPESGEIIEYFFIKK